MLADGIGAAEAKMIGDLLLGGNNAGTFLVALDELHDLALAVGVLTLVLLPALYYLIEERAARRKRPEGPVAYVATEGES